MKEFWACSGQPIWTWRQDSNVGWRTEEEAELAYAVASVDSWSYAYVNSDSLATAIDRLRKNRGRMVFKASVPAKPLGLSSVIALIRVYKGLRRATGRV